jgi:hypothetical protein
MLSLARVVNLAPTDEHLLDKDVNLDADGAAILERLYGDLIRTSGRHNLARNKQWLTTLQHLRVLDN